MFSLWLTACADPPVLTGTVEDAWGRPVPGATLVIEGVVERYEADDAGNFRILPPGPVERVSAARSGYLRQVVRASGGDSGLEPLSFSLLPAPPAPGLYLVGADALVPASSPARLAGGPARLVWSRPRGTPAAPLRLERAEDGSEVPLTAAEAGRDVVVYTAASPLPAGDYRVLPVLDEGATPPEVWSVRVE